MTTVTCPGCNCAFTAGQSMYVHLYHSFHCCGNHVPLSDRHLFWLNPGSTPLHSISNHFTVDCQFHSDNSDPDNESDDITGNVASLVGHDAFLDVVVFQHASTTSQKYEAQLLKIIHSIGAPNMAF